QGTTAPGFPSFLLQGTGLQEGSILGAILGAPGAPLVGGLNANQQIDIWEDNQAAPACEDFPQETCTSSHSTQIGTEIAHSSNTGSSIVYNQTGVGTAWAIAGGALPAPGYL